MDGAETGPAGGVVEVGGAVKSHGDGPQRSGDDGKGGSIMQQPRRGVAARGIRSAVVDRNGRLTLGCRNRNASLQPGDVELEPGQETG